MNEIDAARLQPRPGTVIYRGNRTEIVAVEHPEHGHCVKKCLLPFCDVDIEREALRREASLQRWKGGHGVVRVLEIEDHCFYRSYVSGITLGEGLNDPDLLHPTGKDRNDSVIAVVRQIATILSHLHGGEPLVHRDLTPSNVYLDDDGCVWVSDFGLGFRPALDVIHPDELLQGTARFLAPELLDQNSPTTLTDIYQLGLVSACLLDPRLYTVHPRIPPSARAEQDVRLRQMWHEAAREVLSSRGWGDCLDAQPTFRPTAREFLDLLDR